MSIYNYIVHAILMDGNKKKCNVHLYKMCKSHTNSIQISVEHKRSYFSTTSCTY